MKKNAMIILASALLLSCAHVKPLDGQASAEDDSKRPAQSLPLIDEPARLSVATGKVVFKEFVFRKPDGVYTLACGKRKYRFMVRDHKGGIYLPASYFARPSKVSCVYLDGGEKIPVAEVAVEEFDYPKERLNVPKSKVDYSKEAIKRIIREKEIKRKIYLNSADTYLFDKPFAVPLGSYITSRYGNQRLFNNKKKSQHLGNDLRAATGTKIPAANKGKVVFTGDLFFSGKIVVIDHGMDIFTIYGHLSKILATEGSVVNQGDIVGLAGATGRVSGPHLHWGVKINGSWIDGFSLVDASKNHLLSEETRERRRESAADNEG